MSCNVTVSFTYYVLNLVSWEFYQLRRNDLEQCVHNLMYNRNIINMRKLLCDFLVFTTAYHFECIVWWTPKTHCLGSRLSRAHRGRFNRRWRITTYENHIQD